MLDDDDEVVPPAAIRAARKLEKLMRDLGEVKPRLTGKDLTDATTILETAASAKRKLNPHQKRRAQQLIKQEQP